MRGGRLGWAMTVSGVLHAAALVGLWVAASRASEAPRVKTYAVDIVSLPPQVEGLPSPAVEAPPEQPAPEPAVEQSPPEPPTRDPAPATPEPKPTPPKPAPVEAKPKPAPPKETPKPAEAKPKPAAEKPKATPEPKKEPAKPAEAKPEPKPATGAKPVATSAGGEGLNVRTEGEEFVDRAYLENIIRQVNRHFRRPPESRTDRAEVRFWIARDGSVSDIEVVQSSGSFRFRAAAMEAVEQAGLAKAFGPLPKEYRADRLPVSFYFRPAQ